MLSYATCRHRRKRPTPAWKRRARVQLYLDFLDLPIPENHVWERLNDQQRAVVIEAITRVLTKAALASNTKEQEHE